MRIVTLNTWKCEGDYDRRLACMADGLAAVAPDVVCLQECFVAAGTDTLSALAAATGLRPYASPAREKTRTFRGRPVTSTSGLGMLVDGEVSGFSRVDFPSEPRDPERAAQIVRLATRRGPCAVANLHLTHVPHGETIRGLQLRTVMDALDAARGDAPGLLCGDFNAEPADAALAPLRRRPDADWGTESPLALIGTLLQGTRSRAIDHIVLIGGRPRGWRLRERRRILDAPDPAGVLPSDHAAVLVDVECC